MWREVSNNVGRVWECVLGEQWRALHQLRKNLLLAKCLLMKRIRSRDVTLRESILQSPEVVFTLIGLQ